MSAGTQLQMAPQTTVVQGVQQQQQQQATVHNQDSNMSTGSSHSDKEPETLGAPPDKLPRTPSERKRKRKAIDDSGGGPGGGGGGGGIGGLNQQQQQQHHVFQNNKGARLAVPLPDTKKINDYFNRSSPLRQNSTGGGGGVGGVVGVGGGGVGIGGISQTGNVGGGAKSPSPQLGGYPMYPPSPQQSPLIGGTVTTTGTGNIVGVGGGGGVGLVNAEFYKSRSTSNIVPSSPIQPLLPPPQCQPPPPPPPPPPIPAKVCAATQTDISYLEIQERDTDFELNKTKVDDLTRTSEEQKGQITAHQKVIEQHKNHINKCIDVVKKLLKEKSNIEKKEARQKCMQNRLRLGQFVTQRVGATFQENWTDGYAFQELTRRQEEISAEREEIDRQKKLLTKKRPSNAETGRKRNNLTAAAAAAAAAAGAGGVGGTASAVPSGGVAGTVGGGSGGPAANNVNNSTPGGGVGSGVGGGGVGAGVGGGGGVAAGNSSTSSTGSNAAAAAAAAATLHNGSDATFLKPDPVAGGYTMQEYYECDEILKLRQNALKKEDADLQLETEKLERERNLHIRELKRIHNEDQVSSGSLILYRIYFFN